MPSAPVIDVEALLAPIPGDLPAGELITPSHPVFDQINRLLPEKDTALTEGLDPPKPGQWPALIKLTSETLTTSVKDIRVAARLSQALINKHGFAGVRDALKVMSGMLDKYWEGLSPELDPDDLDARTNPLANLCRETEAVMWIREIPLADRTAPKDGDTSARLPVTYNLHVMIAEKKSETFLPFAKGMADVIRGTAPSFYIKLYGDLGEALTAVEEFKRVTTEKMGKNDAPDVSKLREALLLCKNRIESICKTRSINLAAAAAAAVAETPAEDAPVEESGAAAVATQDSSNGHAGPITTRGEALTRLREIADFLKQREPHSPVSYLINRAIAWSEMPFEKLLLELVTDDASRDKINTTLGIKPYVEGSEHSSSSSSSDSSGESDSSTNWDQQ